MKAYQDYYLSNVFYLTIGDLQLLISKYAQALASGTSHQPPLHCLLGTKCWVGFFKNTSKIDKIRTLNIKMEVFWLTESILTAAG